MVDTFQRMRYGSLCIAGLLAFGSIAAAEPFRCQSTTIAYAGLLTGAPTARPSGVTEQVGDFLIRCYGGTVGTTHEVAVTVSLSVPITSANPTGSKTDALLFVNEPRRDAIAPGQNAYWGELEPPVAGGTAPHTVRFVGVRLSEAVSAEAAPQQLRIVNIRANVAALPAAVSRGTPIIATVDTAPRLPGFPMTGIVAYRWTDQGVAIWPSLSRDYQLEVAVGEATPRDFRTRTSNGQDQAVLGTRSQTESGFITTAFQTAGLGSAGLANSGTRFILRFSNVAPGQQVFVSISPISTVSFPSYTTYARLTATTDEGGGGPYSEVSPTSTSPWPGIAPVTITNGTGIAAYEVLETRTTQVEAVRFGVILVGGTGTPTVEAMLGPLTTGGQTWIPRFAPPRQAPAIAPTGVFRDTANQIRLLEYGNPELYSAGGVFSGKPGAAQDTGGNTWIVARDTAKGLWLTRFDATAKKFDDWRFLGGITAGDPSIAVSDDGGVYYAIRDEWDNCWLGTFRRGVGNTWQHLGGVFSADPQIKWNSLRSVLIAGRDNWGGVWARSFPTSPNLTSDNSAWRYVGGIIEGQLALSDADNLEWLAARDRANRPWYLQISVLGSAGGVRWFPGYGMIDRGPQLAGPLAVGAAADNVWTHQLDRVSGPSPSWTSTGGVLKSEAPAWLNNELYIVGRDASNSIWWYRSSTGHWVKAGHAGVAASEISAAPR